MPSPFPGMDPYLESAAYWRGVHACLITYIRAVLQPLLRPRYNAGIEERLALMPTGRHIYADVNIVGQDVREAATQLYEVITPADTAQARPLALPWIVAFDGDTPPEKYIEIIDTSSREVVTVIEVLSPTNKVGQGADEYERKHNDVLRSRANLVEIDLLSQGVRPFPRPDACDDTNCRYMIGVSRAASRSRYEIYPVALNEPLPKFNIPLRAPDADVPLDLRLVFNRCYDDGAYDDLIDYGHAPDMPLTEAEQQLVTSIRMTSV